MKTQGDVRDWTATRAASAAPFRVRRGWFEERSPIDSPIDSLNGGGRSRPAPGQCLRGHRAGRDAHLTSATLDAISTTKPLGSTHGTH